MTSNGATTMRDVSSLNESRKLTPSFHRYEYLQITGQREKGSLEI